MAWEGSFQRRAGGAGRLRLSRMRTWTAGRLAGSGTEAVGVGSGPSGQVSGCLPACGGHPGAWGIPANASEPEHSWGLLPWVSGEVQAGEGRACSLWPWLVCPQEVARQATGRAGFWAHPV